MNISITVKQVDVSNKLKKHIEETIDASVSKYFSNPLSCNVSFSKEGEEFIAEITVHPTKNIVLKGSGTANDPYSAFDVANLHMATRLRRHKTKISDHKTKTGLGELSAQEAVFTFSTNEEEFQIDDNAPLTIAETGVNVPVCTVSEAIMFMDLANEAALLFKNSANNCISMVYRRKDGNIGWVEPKAA